MNSNVQTSRKKEVEAEEKFESTLSQEQLQALEEENTSMLEGFERTLDQIKYEQPQFENARLTKPVSEEQRRRYWKYQHCRMS